MAKITSDKRVQIGFRAPADWYEQLKDIAASLDMPVGDLIIAAVGYGLREALSDAKELKRKQLESLEELSSGLHPKRGIKP